MPSLSVTVVSWGSTCNGIPILDNTRGGIARISSIIYAASIRGSDPPYGAAPRLSAVVVDAGPASFDSSTVA